MPAIKSAINPRSAEFRANAERMRSLVSDLREKVATVTVGGVEEARDKHVKRGKLLAVPRGRAARRLGDV